MKIKTRNESTVALAETAAEIESVIHLSEATDNQTETLNIIISAVYRLMWKSATCE